MPTVVLEDGRPLGESNAILWHFAEGSAYLPDDPYERAQVLQWMFFEQYKHEPSIAVVRFWVAIADIALYAYTHVAPEGGFDLGPYPADRAWLDRVAGQPGMIAIDAL